MTLQRKYTPHLLACPHALKGLKALAPQLAAVVDQPAQPLHQTATRCVQRLKVLLVVAEAGSVGQGQLDCHQRLKVNLCAGSIPAASAGQQGRLAVMLPWSSAIDVHKTSCDDSRRAAGEATWDCCAAISTDIRGHRG